MGEDSQSGARRPPPPPPAQAQKRATPPPIPGARRVTAVMPAATLRPDSFSGPKPAPEQPPTRNIFKENLGEKAYENLKAALRMLCRVFGMSMQQFLTTADALIFRDLASGQDLQVAKMEYAGGRPELRLYFKELGWDNKKEERCRAILMACSALDLKAEGRLKMLAGMIDIFISVNEKEVSICGANKPGGDTSLSFFLHVQ